MAVQTKPKSKESAKKAPEKKVINPPFKVAGIGGELDDITLNGKHFRSVVTQEVETADLSRTIEGASTVDLEVFDPRKALLKSSMFKARVGLELDELHFTYVQMGKSGRVTKPTFEDREVSWLRQLKGPKKALRSKVTRAEFILSLIRAVKQKTIPVYIPELHVVQPIGSSKEHAEAKSANEDTPGAPGLGKADLGHVTVKHEAASLSEIHVIDQVLDTGMSMGVSFKLLVCSIMTITQETHAINENLGSAGIGPFSQEPGTWGTSYPGATNDVPEDARGFFQVAIKEDQKNPNQSMGELCQSVQNAGAGNLYDQWETEATTTVRTYLGGADAGSAVTQTVKKPYAFEVKKKETYWDAITRLAKEVEWRAFFVGGTFFYISEEALFRGQVRLNVSEEAEGIDNVDFDVDDGKAGNEATITAHAKRWSVPPGLVVRLENLGPADGRWLVSSIDGSLLTGDARTVDITVKKPSKAKPEPAPETKTQSLNVPGGGGADSVSGIVIKDFSLGPPSWGGTAAIFKQFIHPFMEERGLQPGAEKEEGHAEGSDHALYSKDAYAADYPTTDGGKIANELGRALGRDGSSVGTFDRFNITVDGHTFSVQILWHVPDHYDHVHVGINTG